MTMFLREATVGCALNIGRAAGRAPYTRGRRADGGIVPFELPVVESETRLQAGS
jgi:hypothetical protein